MDETNFPVLGAAGTGAAAPSWAGSSQVKDSVKAAPVAAVAAGAKGSAREAALHIKAPLSLKAGSKGDWAAAAPWVQTGEALSEQYATAREVARGHARVRNAYFQQATQAYLIGNKALAKELGAQGRAANEAMKKAHKSASDKLYSLRNNGDGRQGASLQMHNGEPMIDLHGQHVAEAVAALRREISRLRGGSGGKRSLFICVGTGSHTKGANTPARLAAAVESFLGEENIS